MIHIDASSIQSLRDRMVQRIKRLDPNNIAESTAKKRAPQIQRNIRAHVAEGLKRAAKTPSERKAAVKMGNAVRVRHRRVNSENHFDIDQPVFEGAQEFKDITSLNFAKVKSTIGDDIREWVKNEKDKRDADFIKTGRSRKKFHLSAKGEKIYAVKRVKTVDEITDRVIAAMSYDPKHWLRQEGKSTPTGSVSLVDFLQQKNPIGLAATVNTPGPGVKAVRAEEMSQEALRLAEEAIINDMVMPVLEDVAKTLESIFGK